MLTASEIVAGYQRGAPVLDGVSLSLRPGRTIGLHGASGCGKSTLVRVLALLHQPWSGSVTIDGQPVRGYRYAAPAVLRRSVGVVFQQPRPSVDPRFTLRRVVGEAASGPIEDVVALVGLGPELLDRRVHEVSEGQLQRACLARALAVRPRYLLCDEMTAMLDASTTAALVSAVREYCAAEDVGVLAVSHDSALLSAWADEVVAWPPSQGAAD